MFKVYEFFFFFLKKKGFLHADFSQTLSTLCDNQSMATGHNMKPWMPSSVSFVCGCSSFVGIHCTMSLYCHATSVAGAGRQPGPPGDGSVSCGNPCP